MHYNYTEEEKVFLHISHSLLEEGYDVDEIVEFWISEDDEHIESVLGSVSLSETVDMQNDKLVDICEKAAAAGGILKWLRSSASKIRAGLKGAKPMQGPAQTTKVLPGTASKTANTTTKVVQAVKSIPGKIKNLPRGVKVGAAVVTAGLGAGLLTPPPPGDVASSDSDENKGQQAGTSTGTSPGTTSPGGPGEDEKNKKDEKPTGINKPGKYWWQTYERRPNLDQSVALRDYRNIRAHVEMVADYLISEGHADTFEEAEYIMNQLDEDYINYILEAGEGRVNLTYPAGHPKYGQPLKVDGKPMSVSKRTAEWNSKMNRYKEQNPAGYKKAKSMMSPYGWTEPPAGYTPPDWM